LLKQVERGIRGYGSKMEQVLDELILHRDAATDPNLRSAPMVLCDALSALIRVFSPARKRQHAAASVTDLAVLGVWAAARTEPDCL
jgi:hypothetical protein